MGRGRAGAMSVWGWVVVMGRGRGGGVGEVRALPSLSPTLLPSLTDLILARRHRCPQPIIQGPPGQEVEGRRRSGGGGGDCGRRRGANFAA